MKQASGLFISLLGMAMICALPLDTGVEMYTIDLSVYGKDLYRVPKLSITVTQINLTSSTPSEPILDEERKDEGNPEEMGDYVEGDILVALSEISSKNMPAQKSTTWHNGIVPFHIEEDFTDQEVDMILHAMEYVQSETCIIFTPHTFEEDFISITNMYDGCWSAIGRMGGPQFLNLQTPSCLKKIGTPIHELLHALGFPHEQNRNKRDDYVFIVNENIISGYLNNFHKDERAENFGVSYDYGSIMHYSKQAFSMNGQPTILPLQRTVPGVQMGQRSHLSPVDIMRLNRMYCEDKIKTRISPP